MNLILFFRHVDSPFQLSFSDLKPLIGEQVPSAGFWLADDDPGPPLVTEMWSHGPGDNPGTKEVAGKNWPG